MVPGAPPAGTASFYKKYLDGNGIPVQSSAAVSDAALQAACTIVVRMLNKRDDVRQVMIGQQMRVAVIGENEVTTDVPEYANLNQMFPQQDWDRLRGVAHLADPGQLRRRREPSLPRGRLLRRRADPGQTFATAVLLGMEEADSTFDSRLRDAYDAAISAGLWRTRTPRRTRSSITRRPACRPGSRLSRSHAGQRDPQRDRHRRRAARLRSDAGRAGRRDDARRLLAPEVPLS